MYIQFSDKPICWTLKVGIPVLFGGCTHVAMRIRILDWSWAHAEISRCDVTSVVASFQYAAPTPISISIYLKPQWPKNMCEEHNQTKLLNYGYIGFYEFHRSLTWHR